MSDTVNDEYNVPLLKQPRQKKSSQQIEEVKPEVKAVVKKTRPPKTAKQMEQFKKAVEARKQKIDQNKLNKKIEASKFLVEQGIIKEETKEEVKKPKQRAPSKEWDLEKQYDSESSEEQVVVIKKKKKPKKKVIVVQESDSSDSESEYEKPTRNFKTQQNKKSIVKIHSNNKNDIPNNNYKNYFV